MPSSSSFATVPPLSSDSEWVPATEADRELVRAQLRRILANQLFRNSRRFPSFLQYAVEHALTPDAGPLKERTIGIEVFGREPTYDTSQDPVVRMTAGEVRKRLTQYYQLPDAHDQVRIIFEPGSYVPEFALPHPTHDVLPAPTKAPERSSSRGWILVATALVLLAAGAALGRSWMTPAKPNRAIDQFWSPFVESTNPVLLCIGDPSWSGMREASDALVEELKRRNYVRFTDAASLTLIAGELGTRQKAFRIRRPKSTEFDDLRDGPSVFIGGFNNPWTVRLSEDLRFTLARDGDEGYVRDSQQPGNREWKLAGGVRAGDVRETYGIATRMLDSETGQTVLMTSGLLLGTRAAAECLVDASCMDEVQRQVQGELTHKNVQIVVETKVIDEDSGVPKIVAVHTW